jgi:CDP-glucose 4,6-dehydratase
VGIRESALEDLVGMAMEEFLGFYRGKTVLVTGHTGFKGSWLAFWLHRLGARVVGYSLAPPTTPSLFEGLRLADLVEHHLGDIRDPEHLQQVVKATAPGAVFHLAAQPIVRESYKTPVPTYDTNVMGTIHLLEALRCLSHPCSAVFITSDKCYENREWVYGYRETDPLGGHDPYSSSKAAAEIAISAWRRSFFRNHPVRIASARAGNVIGGGDWAKDRIVPDCIRALQQGQPIVVRNRLATRPWQHVLEPLSGYLWLAALLGTPSSPLNPTDTTLDTAFNFGPLRESNRPVEALVAEILRHWPGTWEDRTDPEAVHEAALLHLSIDKAQAHLGWHPVLDFATTIRETVRWYSQAHQDSKPERLRELTADQLDAYIAQARIQGLGWARSHLPSLKED